MARFVDSRLSTIVLVLAAPLVGQAGGGWSDTSGDTESRSKPKSTWSTALRLARSDDGVSFADTGRGFLLHAAAPDLVRLPDGELLALFDYAAEKVGDATPVMAISRSKDGGRSWTPLRPITLRGRRGSREVQGVHGDLMVLPDGEIRLYFAERLTGGRTRAKGHTVIRSAMTRDGLEYRLDGATRVTLAGGEDLHPTAARVDGRVHLYAAALTSRLDDKRATPGRTQHLISGDGRRFARLAGTTPGRSPRAPDARFVGSVTRVGDGVRAFVSDARGIISLASDNGVDWRLKEGVLIANAWDPAVTRLEDGSYLMVYCTTAKKRSRASAQLVYAAEVPRRSASSRDAAGGGGAGGEVSLDAEAIDAAVSEALAAAGEHPERSTEDPAADAATSIGSGDADGSPQESEYADDGDALTADSDDFWEEELTYDVRRDGDGVLAPRPDFRTKVDYIEWYYNMLGDPADNAYYAYAEFIAGPPGHSNPVPEWPKFNDMFNSGDHKGPPIPWDPAKYPKWAQTSRNAADLLAKYREATLHEGYATPPMIHDDDIADTPGEEPLLMGVMLPQLSSHRTLCKATLADAWQLEDGKVSSERMLEAWRTVLRGANHLDQGGTLIEDLVATAERGLLQRNALWALKHDVFSEDELETALDVLIEYDRDDHGPEESIRFEHAAMMDTTQYMFTPPGPDGQPHINRERAEHVMSWAGIFGESKVDLDDWIERASRAGPEGAYATLDAADACYTKMFEQMQTGYPDVRAADVEATTQKYVNATPLTEIMLPALGRVHKLHGRSQTMRRATQLAYATHLFKAQNGRWPESLDELAPEYGERMLTDPFSGDYFGYRLTDDGPRIYSASENGLDDGGVHSPRWDDEITNDAGSDDYVFWPPQPRPPR